MPLFSDLQSLSVWDFSRVLRLCFFYDLRNQFGTGPIFAFEDLLEPAAGIDHRHSHVMRDAAGRVVPEGQAK